MNAEFRENLDYLSNKEFTKIILSWKFDEFITKENITILEKEVYERLSKQNFKAIEEIRSISDKKDYSTDKLNKILKLTEVAKKLEQIKKSFIIKNDVLETGNQIKWILNEEHISEANKKLKSEQIFNIEKWLKNWFNELAKIYGAENISEKLRNYLNSNGENKNFIDFLKFIEPDKEERKGLYERILNISKSRDLIILINQAKSNEELLNRNNFKSIYSFYFSNTDLLEHNFFEEFNKSNGNIESTIKNLRDKL